MLLAAQTIDPTLSSSPAEFVSGPPVMRSPISKTVAHSELTTSTDTSPTESARSHFERRVISPGSPMTTATRSRPSMVGSSQLGPGRT
jgi:hypothetical protein